MKRSVKIALISATAGLSALTLALPANAVDVYIGTPGPNQAQVPPRNGAWGDRDRDGIPNAVDSYNNNRGRSGRGDQDHDGVPNRYDRDRDGDGVPNQWDRNPSNPYRR
jgi:hypothetical protein